MPLKSSIQITRLGDSRVDPLVNPVYTPRGRLRNFVNNTLGIISGAANGGAVIQRDTAAAYAYFTASTSGDFTISINGDDTVTAFDTSQTVTAGNAVINVNASTDALAYGGRTIEADNRQLTITLTSCAVGETWLLCGYRLLSVAKTARGGLSRGNGQFEISGSDTADAAAMVVAINTYPGLQDLVVADNSSGVVTVRSRRASTPARNLGLLYSGEAASANVLTASTVVTVSCVRKGAAGNWITTAVTGTGTAVSGARMTGGATTFETL